MVTIVVIVPFAADSPHSGDTLPAIIAAGVQILENIDSIAKQRDTYR